jgi:hypothetical protein
MTDDRLLVESAIRGELSAFNHLMKSWHKRIFNFAYRYLNDYDEASEVTQQTFIKAYQALGTLKDPGAVPGVALHHCQQRLPGPFPPCRPPRHRVAAIRRAGGKLRLGDKWPLVRTPKSNC